jgi:hypothetical protein
MKKLAGGAAVSYKLLAVSRENLIKDDKWSIVW